MSVLTNPKIVNPDISIVLPASTIAPTDQLMIHESASELNFFFKFLTPSYETPSLLSVSAKSTKNFALQFNICAKETFNVFRQNIIYIILVSYRYNFIPSTSGL